MSCFYVVIHQYIAFPTCNTHTYCYFIACTTYRYYTSARNVDDYDKVTSIPTKAPSGLDDPSPTSPGGSITHMLTGADMSSNSGGVMFTLTATEDISVASFDILVKTDGSDSVMVFTRQGSFESYEFNDDGWELVFNNNVEANKNELTNIGELDQAVSIAAGQTQAFYIWAKKELLYEAGNSPGETFATDGTVSIQQGTALKKAFQQVVGNAKYSGGVWYSLV